MFGNTISCEERVENRFRYQSGKTSKNGYEYLDDQLGSLKDKVKINQYQSAESVNDLWEARGYKSPYKEKTVVQNITLTEDTKFVRVYDGVNSNLKNLMVSGTKISGVAEILGDKVTFLAEFALRKALIRIDVAQHM